MPLVHVRDKMKRHFGARGGLGPPFPYFVHQVAYRNNRFPASEKNMRFARLLGGLAESVERMGAKRYMQ